MSTPVGDLPDWQTLVSPLVTAASLFQQPGGIVVPIFTSPNAFRVWGAWISFHMSSAAAYVNGLALVDATIEDGAGNGIFTIGGDLRTANQVVCYGLSVAIPGLTPVKNAGSFTINLATGSIIANMEFTVSCGIYYSQP